MDCLNAPALVTGAAKRVGRAIAIELARAGCDVVVHFNTSADEAAETAEQVRRLGRRAALIQADLGDPDVVREIVPKAVEALGGLAILVNNASVFDSDDVSNDASRQQALRARTYQVNTFAPATLVDMAGTAMVRAGAGKIINLCDISEERPWPRYGAYCSSKAALACMTKAWARQLAPAVQVNGVAPGIAVFPESYDAATRRKLVDRVPLKRAGEPADIARAVRFLVAEGDYITGQIINVDGGRSIR